MSPLSRKNIWLSQKKKILLSALHSFHNPQLLSFFYVHRISFINAPPWVALGACIRWKFSKIKWKHPQFQKERNSSPSRNFRKLCFYNQNINWSEGFWHLYWKIKKELPLFRSCIIKICQVSKMKALIFKFGRFGYFCF